MFGKGNAKYGQYAGYDEKSAENAGRYAEDAGKKLKN